MNNLLIAIVNYLLTLFSDSMKYLLFILPFLIILIGCNNDEASVSVDAPLGKDVEFQNGDIIFQTSQSGQSKAIQLATHSKYSHVGIIYNNGGKYFVYEAVQPVKLTPLDKWIDRGLDDHYVVKRLKNADEILTKEALSKMKKVGERYKGKNYDIYFEWSDDKIYCSELVWKVYKEGAGIEIGELEQLRDFDLSHEIVKQKMKERYGDNIPMDEKVISPAVMFDSDELITVKEE